MSLSKRELEFIKKLWKLADEADRMDLALPNGGLVGSLIGTMAADVEKVLEARND